MAQVTRTVSLALLATGQRLCYSVGQFYLRELEMGAKYVLKRFKTFSKTLTTSSSVTRLTSILAKETSPNSPMHKYFNIWPLRKTTMMTIRVVVLALYFHFLSGPMRDVLPSKRQSPRKYTGSQASWIFSGEMDANMGFIAVQEEVVFRYTTMYHTLILIQRSKQLDRVQSVIRYCKGCSREKQERAIVM